MVGHTVVTPAVTLWLLPSKKFSKKKDDTAKNVFRDVFATSVLTTTSGTQISNTANALALVNLFCEIVVEADKNVNREKFKTHVQSENGCIHWDFLKNHCSSLISQLGKLFNEKAFSFTGYGRKREDLNKEKFAEKTANWLRENLEKVRGNLEKIQQFESEHDGHANEFARLPKHHTMLQEYYAALGPYFTKNLFPYGFTFYGEKEYLRENAPYELLRAEDNGNLVELKKILDGKGCPAPPPKPRPRPAPAPRPPNPAPQPGRARTPGRRTSGPSSYGGWSSVGSLVSGARRGSDRGIRPNRRGAGSGAPSDRGRGPGVKGAVGAKSAQRGRHPGRPMSTKPQHAQSQNDSQRHSQQHPPPAASSAPRVADPPAEQLPTSDRLVSQAPVQAQSSASSSSSSSSSVTIIGDQDLGPQAAASGHSQGSSQTSMGSTVTLPHASPLLEPGKQSGPSQDSMQPGTSDPLSSGSTYSGGVASTRHSPQSTPVSQYNKDVGMGSISQPSHTLPSDSGAGERVGPGGAPSTGGSLTAAAKDTVPTASEPVAPLSVDPRQTPSIHRQNSLSHGDGDPGRVGSSLPQAGSSHDGPPVAVDTPVDQAPGPDSMVASGIHPSVSSNAMNSQTSNVQSPDSLSSVVPPPGGDQGRDRQTLSSNPAQRISHQPSDVGSAHQGTSVADHLPSAVSSADSGVGGGAGGGGSSAGGTDGDSQVDVHSRQSPKASQPSVQHHTPSHSPRDSASDIADSPGDRGLALQSPPLINPQGDTGDASGHSPASIPRPPGLDPLGESQDLATRVQQLTQVQGNGPLSQPGPALHVPPPPPSAPNPITAAEPLSSQHSVHGPMKSKDLQDPPVMQTPGPNLMGDTDHTGPLNQHVSSSSTVAHDPAGKSRNGDLDPTSGKLQSPQPDDIHGAALTQPSSVSGSKSSLTAVSPSGGGKDPDNQVSLLVPVLPHAKTSKVIPATLPITSPGLPPGQKIGGDAGSGSPGATIGDPNLQNRQTVDNNLSSSGTSMNSGSDSSHQIPPQTSMPDPPRIELEIEKFYTPEMIYGADTFQGEPLPAAEHKRIVSPSDTYSDIPPHAPFPETFYPKITGVVFEDKCLPPWITNTHNDNLQEFPDTELFPSEAPRTVKEMLIWLVGLQNPKHHVAMEKCIKTAFGSMPDATLGDHKLSVNDAEITPKQVLDALKLTAMFAASVLSTIEPAWKGNTTLSATLKLKGSDQSKDPDCCTLLCRLRDYVYACCHQLAFLKSQCSREQSHGGWQNHEYGHGVSPQKSPLQAFLTDAHDSKFTTYPFDPCNVCLKSRVRMGFRADDLPDKLETGNVLLTILSPSCGGEDPLLTLSSYLSCLTRRTPRTTGELVSFFHNFGNSLHDAASILSKLGSALSTRHGHYPDWDILAADDLQVIKYARDSAPPTSNHAKGHPRTLSTLVGCGIDNSNCPQHMTPITYRAYALYSPSFVHHYLSWTVYLPDRLWESLQRMSVDLQDHVGIKCAPLYACQAALPLLYSHGFTPPEVASRASVTCSKVVAKLEEVVSGQPIASLMTAMDDFLYGIRMPFLYTLLTLWSIAALYIAYTTLYRLDVMHIRSHLLRSKVSHLIDVKALLSTGRKMLSLYRDVDYFDDDPVG
ncbi:Ribosome-binding protein 1 [Babesia ovata]|uniref:Ribosome-binding protein 1 n=1 Tax=Babesia ovata TaxID=189622 RepID=A0A2H6K8S9_9APIC|nr:Ribosome-binding protein 1 [Babesia ovata]GBE59405.1 Ribosome-binding protein 1 [Babesia ovata]